MRSEQTLLALMRASDVVLDPFPVGNAVLSLQALSVGAPVVTLPGEFLKSRLTLAMLERLQVLDLVAKSEADYARIALSVAHSEARRELLSSAIVRNAGHLFEDFRAVREWERFLKTIAKETKKVHGDDDAQREEEETF